MSMSNVSLFLIPVLDIATLSAKSKPGLSEGTSLSPFLQPKRLAQSFTGAKVEFKAKGRGCSNRKNTH